MQTRKSKLHDVTSLRFVYLSIALCLTHGCAVLNSHATAARAIEISRTHDLLILQGASYCFSKKPFAGIVPDTCWTNDVDVDLWKCANSLSTAFNAMQPVKASIGDLEECMAERGWKEGTGIWVGGPHEGFLGTDWP
jgi:hypothetical protein